MLKLLLELIVTLLLTSVMLTLLVQRRRVRPAHFGYDLLTGGIILITMAGWLDWLNFDESYPGLPVAASTVFDILQLAVGYIGGVFLVAMGLLLWIPALSRYQRLLRDRIQTKKDLFTEQTVLKGLMESAQGCMFVVDPKGYLVRWSRPFAELTGLPEERIRKTRIQTLVTEESLEILDAFIREVSEKGFATAEFGLVRAEGRPVPMLGTGARISLRGEDHIAGFAMDITDRKIAEGELREHNEALRIVNSLVERLQQYHELKEIAEQAVEVLTDYRCANYISFYSVNESETWLTLVAEGGYIRMPNQVGGRIPVAGTLSGIPVRTRELVVITNLSKDKRFDRKVIETLQSRNVYSAVLIPLIFKDEVLGAISLLYDSPFDFPPLEVSTYQAIGRAVSLALVNSRHLGALVHQAHHDTLTRLPNRVLFHLDFEQFQILEHPPEEMVLYLLDLDRFKEINDTLGHEMGDEFLKQVGPRLKRALTSDADLIYRLGGDEFAIIIPCSLSPSDALNLGKRFLQEVQQPFIINGMMLEVGGSIGVAIYPRDGGTSHVLLRHADVAMYEAKRTGIGCLLYDESIDKHSPERLALIAELSSAIRTNQLRIYYQPQMDLKTGKLHGVEALLRWEHPRLGRVMPDEFIPIAELSAVINDLTRWLLRTTIAQQRTWQANGLDIKVAINLSARNLLDQQLLSELEEAFQNDSQNGSTLELELTETALMHDSPTAIEVFHRIDPGRLRIAVDDFGTGYSSLANLKRFHLHTLKVDRSFVLDMLQDEQSRAIVETTIQLAHSLGLAVVAEGVEDEATLNALRDLGCDYVQGFYFSVPLPAEELEAWLAGAEVMG